MDEISKLKRNANACSDEPCLILLGFKTLNAIDKTRMHQFPLIDRSLFAYPNDDSIQGSRVAFATLHSSMLRKNVIGIGEILQRVTATSRLVAIVPQEEKLANDNDCSNDDGDEESEGMVQERPPGFLLIPLSYEDDVRAIPEAGHYEADEDMVSAVEGFMDKLKLDNFVIGESFENPALKAFWNYMESVALGTPLVEDDLDEDDTNLDAQVVLSVCGKEIDSFKNILPDDEVVEKEKKRRVASLKADQTGIDWFHEYKENTFETLSVEELKAYCRSQGEKVGGRKADLIARVRNHLSSRVVNETTDRNAPTDQHAYL